MVALIGLGDQLVDLAVGDLVQDAVALADGDQDGVEHLVDALDDLAIGALERRRVAALFQLALAAELGQLGQLGLEPLQDDGDAVHVLLHLLMVALVGLGDQLVDLAMGDLVEDAVAFANGQERRVQHLVDRRKQCLGILRSGRNVGADSERPVSDGLGEPLDLQQFHPRLAMLAQFQE